MTALASITATTSIAQFHRITAESGKKLTDLEEIFHRVLTPLYGSQEDALNKIKVSSDRVCHLLYQDELPVGVLVFKTVFSNEFEKQGLARSIEIKSLFVNLPEVNSGKGYGNMLLSKAFEEARKLNLDHDHLHVTVSESKPESLGFFRLKGFQIQDEWVGRYIPDVKEYLLAKPT